MNDQALKLIELTEEWKASFQAMAEEHHAAGEDRYHSELSDFPAYLRRLSNDARGIELPEGRVPQTTYWLVRGSEIIGRSSLRHRLTPGLEREGGNIGYDIRPSERRKGYGTLILYLMLEKARNHGLSRVLVTCNTENIASAKIIEKNGGKLHELAVSVESGKPVSQYWIEL